MLTFVTTPPVRRGSLMRLMTRMLALALIGVVGVPGVAAAAPPRQDSVTAVGGTNLFSNIRIDVSSGPLGENPTGTVSFDVPSFGVHVANQPITCLNASGRLAAIGVPMPGTGFIGLVLVVADNGPAGSGLDRVTFSNLGEAPTACPAPFPGGESLTSGDVVVVDTGRRRGLGCGDEGHVHTGAPQCGQPGLTAGLKEDSVTGSGDFGLFTDLSLSVRSGPFGENPTGSIAVTVTFFGTRFETASISCLAVSGTAATIGGTLKPNSAGFSAVLAQVTDNGASAPDSYSASPLGSAPTTCPPPIPFVGFGTTGDIVVLDAGRRRGLGCGDPNHTHSEAVDCKPGPSAPTG